MTALPDLAIFGCGAWGTALASTWARQGARVALWGHPPELVQDIALTRRHSRLGEVEVHTQVRPTSDPQEAFKAPIWVSALPTQVSPEVWARLGAAARTRPELLIHASKGILQRTHLRVSEVLEPLLGVPVGVLSGPTFADEVARELPAAIVMALPGTVEEARAGELQALLATPRFRVYLSRDVLGVELCGALKNVLAIAAGLVTSLGLGNNARAALMTRGLVEMARLVDGLGGHPETVMGLAGMGDLFLTATGPQSRNRQYGELLGQGLSPQQADTALKETVVEGVTTTFAALELAEARGLDLPITQEVARLIRGADPREAVNRLMTRSLKTEGFR